MDTSLIMKPDRRLFRRFSVGLEITVVLEDQQVHSRLFDISLGGAAIHPADPSWAGKQILMRSEEFGIVDGLTCEVLDVAAGIAHLRFRLSAAEEEALTFFLMTSDLN